MYIGEIPEIFIIADKYLEEERKEFYKDRPPREIPVPRIDSNPNIRGPLYTTPEWREQTQKELDKLYRERDREARKRSEKVILRLLAKKANLHTKLLRLNKDDPRDLKKIAHINFKIKEIDEQLEDIQNQTGIDLDDLETGSKLERFWQRVKDIFSNACKKVKKFFKKNKKSIKDVLIVAIPVIIACVFKKFFLAAPGPA